MREKTTKSRTATSFSSASTFDVVSREGLPIRGHIDAPQKARAVAVIVHGFKGFKDWGFFPWLGEYLCDAGIAAVRFNMSRSGIGENPESFDRLDLFRDDTYSTQIHDLVAIAEFARNRFRGLPLFLVGHSRGGGVALLAAREIEELEGIVTWNAISHADRWDDQTKRRWRAEGSLDVINARTNEVMPTSTAVLDDYERHRERLDILDSASRLRVPLLAIHGAGDESVPVAEAHEIVSRVRDGSLVVIGGASHTFNAIHPLVHVPHALEYAALLTAHFIAAYA